MEQLWEDIYSEIAKETLRITCPDATPSTMELAWSYLRLDPWSCDEKPAPNSLRYVTIRDASTKLLKSLPVERFSSIKRNYRISSFAQRRIVPCTSWPIFTSPRNVTRWTPCSHLWYSFSNNYHPTFPDVSGGSKRSVRQHVRMFFSITVTLPHPLLSCQRSSCLAVK